MLGNLCWIYDSNRITIEGHTDLAFSDDVAARFLAYGWNVQRVGDANDTERLAQAIERFRRTNDAPTLIIVESHIGYGAPHKHDTSAAHGEPLGEEEIRLAKRSYGWPEDAKFLVPAGVREHFQDGMGRRGRSLQQIGAKLFDAYRSKYPDLADQIERMQQGELCPTSWDAALPVFAADAKGLATRESSGKVLNAIASHHPWLIGGAADLAPSTKTRLTFEGAGDLEADTPGGRNMHFGVREHAMGAILNGLAVSKLRPFGAGFLIFSDYMKPPIRLAALMELPVIYVFTHDSIGVGEDGPTHQPIEQLVALRSIPGLITLRPADANEVVEAWRVIIGLQHQPACLALSRQALPTFDRTRYAPAAGRRPRRLCSRRCPGRQAGGDPDRHRQRGCSLHRGLRGAHAAGHSGARRQHAVMGAVRAAGPGVPRRRPSAGRHGARLGRDGLGDRLGSLCRRDRRQDRHDARFGSSAPLKDLLTKFGFTPAKVRCRREGADRKVQRQATR